MQGKHCSERLTDFLKYVIHTHRPWLITLFLKFLMKPSEEKTDLETLQDVCGKVGHVIMETKRAKREHMWFMGQKRLPLCVYRAAKRPLADYMVYGHMAYLGLPGHVDSVTLELRSSGLHCNGEAFEPFAYFPSAESEALLYLGLLQSPSTNAFVDPESEEGTRYETMEK